MDKKNKIQKCKFRDDNFLEIDLSNELSYPWCFVSGEERIEKILKNNNDISLVWFLCDKDCEERIFNKYPQIKHQLINVDQFGVHGKHKYCFAIKQIALQQINYGSNP